MFIPYRAVVIFPQQLGQVFKFGLKLSLFFI
ncbi:unnamed protein product, partial [marine sediment metagenome]